MPEIIKQLESSKPLRGKELGNVLKALSEERGLDPVDVDRFLKLDPESARPLKKIDIVYPSAAVVTYIATRALFESLPQVPKGPELPLLLHNTLQAIYALGNNAANSPALADHLPYLSITLGAIWAGKNTLPKWLSGNSLVEKVQTAQDSVKEKISKGEMEYNMADGHTAAFVGRGDILADTLQTEKDKSMVMKYADVPISEEVWQLIKENGSQEDVFKALDRASFKNAGEVLILPVKAEDMVLPSEEDGHDMSLDQISAKIKICADYCTSREIAQKRIIVVGDLDHKESYSTRTSDRKATTEIKTLRQVLNETQIGLQNEGIKIDIVSEDPTKDTISEVARLADGRKIEYHATHESDARYGKRFYNELKQSGNKVQKEAKGITRVFYNIDDIPTEMNIDSDDIAIVLNKEVKERLLAKGKFNPENIICPTERMSKKLSSRVDET